nr:unnamed protein product [Digitaria exilis]
MEHQQQQQLLGADPNPSSASRLPAAPSLGQCKRRCWHGASTRFLINNKLVHHRLAKDALNLTVRPSKKDEILAMKWLGFLDAGANNNDINNACREQAGMTIGAGEL